MPVLLNPNEPVRYEPAGQDAVPAERRVAYYLKVPTVYDGPALTRAVRSRGGRQWSQHQKIAALRAGVREVCGDDTALRESTLAQVDVFVREIEQFQHDCVNGVYGSGSGPEDPATRDAFAAALSRNMAADTELGAMLERVAEGYPRLMDMLADEAAWPELRGVEAARLFLTGWENIAAAFSRDRNGVAPALLAAVPRHHRVMIGYEVQRLLSPTETEAKNSDSPSPGSSDEPTSTAASDGPTTTPGNATAGA